MLCIEVTFLITLLCLGTEVSLMENVSWFKKVKASELFGSKSPYCVGQGDDLHRLRSHKIIQVFGMFRHGTRDPSEKDCEDMNVLDTIKYHIGANHLLSSTDIDAIKNWTNISNKNKSLIDQGRIDMEEIASRFRSNLKNVFGENFNPTIHKVRCSPERRSKESAYHFLRKAFDDDTFSMDSIPVWDEHDVTLNIDKLRVQEKRLKKKGKNELEVDKFEKSSGKIDETIQRVTNKLDYERALNIDEIRAMYEACRHDYTRNVKTSKEKSPAWCNVFDENDFKNLEYMDDLKWVAKFGYKSYYGDKLGCPLLMRIKMSFEAAISGQGASAVLNFGHRINIFVILTMLGLAYDSEEINAFNMDRMDNRNWRTSYLNPFASNVALVLSSLNDNYYVSAFVNENIVPLTMNNQEQCTICEWSQVQAKFQSFINRHDTENFESVGCSFGHTITLP